MALPYTFANYGGETIPAAWLDANFTFLAPAVNGANYPSGSSQAIAVAAVAIANGVADNLLANVNFAGVSTPQLDALAAALSGVPFTEVLTSGATNIVSWTDRASSVVWGWYANAGKAYLVSGSTVVMSVDTAGNLRALGNIYQGVTP
jgi:hypothetical protein